MTKPRPVLSLFLILLCGDVAATSLTSTQLSAVEYELHLLHDSPLEIEQAQGMMYQATLKICNGKNPLYGKYKFNSKEPVTKNIKDPDSFSFIQKISCVDKSDAPIIHKKSNLSDGEITHAKAAVAKLTESYLSTKDRYDFKQAYAMLTSDFQDLSDLETWTSRESKYISDLGEFISRDIWRLTLYDNPENSPQPGIYIAADYESRYQNSSIYCGYVVWFALPDKPADYKVVREEYGNISNEIIKKISPAELQTLRTKMECRAI